MKNYMGLDQYGTTYHNLGPHPRKELMDRLCVSHASKMYVDKTSGKSVHVGYVISNLWISLYTVEPFEK